MYGFNEKGRAVGEREREREREREVLPNRAKKEDEQNKSKERRIKSLLV